MRWRSLWIVPTVLLAGTLGRSPAQTITDASGGSFSAEELATITSAFLPVLSDPQSAQIVKLNRASNGMVCGFVNAKNSFGGYVGFRDMVVDMNRKEAFIMPDLSNLRISSREEGAYKIKAISTIKDHCLH
jgi:hypothetical protein